MRKNRPEWFLKQLRIDVDDLVAKGAFKDAHNTNVPGTEPVGSRRVLKELGRSADRIAATRSAASQAERNLMINTEEFWANQPRVAEPGVRPEGKNRIVTEERVAAARKRIRSKQGRLSMGLDPTLLKAYTELGLYHMERGARKFSEWGLKMVEECGDDIKPHLRDLYIKTGATLGYDLRKTPKTPTKAEPTVAAEPTIKPEGPTEERGFVTSVSDSRSTEFSMVRFHARTFVLTFLCLAAAATLFPPFNWGEERLLTTATVPGTRRLTPWMSNQLPIKRYSFLFADSKGDFPAFGVLRRRLITTELFLEYVLALVISLLVAHISARGVEVLTRTWRSLTPEHRVWFRRLIRTVRKTE